MNEETGYPKHYFLMQFPVLEALQKLNQLTKKMKYSYILVNYWYQDGKEVINEAPALHFFTNG